MSNFSNLFVQYPTSAAYIAARDAMLEQDENPALKNDIVGAGVYNYQNKNPFTIGYGYDVSKQSGSQIISDFEAAGIFTASNILSGGTYYALYTALQNYGSGGTSDAGFSAVNTQFANAFGSGNGLNSNQAKDLLDVVTPRYEEAVATTLSIYNDTASFGNNGLTQLLVSEDYNGGNIVGSIQASDIASDNVTAFIENVLFFNNKSSGSYSQGLENRRVFDLASAVGLQVTSTSIGGSYVVNGITFNKNVTAALDIAEAITQNYTAISSQITTLGAGNLTTLEKNLLSNAETTLIAAGYYVAQSDDTLASIASEFGVTTQTLQQINAPFADSALYNNGNISTGGLVHVPIGAGTALSLGDSGAISATLPALPSGEAYVLDPSSSTVYRVGASLDGSNSGALIVDVPSFGGFDTFAAGTYSGVGLEANGDVDVSLVTASGDPLGTLTFNPSTNAGTLTLADNFPFFVGNLLESDNLAITLTGGQALNITDPAETPEQVLLSYLSELGDPLTAAQLDQDNYNYLNPTVTAYTVMSDYTVGVNNNTAADAYYSASTPGAVIAGQDTVDITYFDFATDTYVQGTVPVVNNTMLASGDISQDTISNIQTLSVEGAIALTADQFNSFSTIEGGVADIAATTAGTFSLAGSNIDPNNSDFGELTATDFGGTTLIGNDTAGQHLVASSLGDDTLIAGNGAGDTLIAGNGDDTLMGGSGGDTFYLGGGVDTVQGGSGNDTFVIGYNTYADDTPSPGTTIVGGGGSDTLSGGGDITGVSISGVQTLDGSFTLTVAQLGEFSTVEGSQFISDTAANIQNGLASLMENADNIYTVTATDVPVSVSVATFEADQPVLDEIDGGFDISDTAANIENGLASLTAGDWEKIASITATDVPVSVSVATFWAAFSSDEWLVFDKIAGGVSISDTAANIENDLPELWGYQSYFTSITATDTTVSVPMVTFFEYQSVLNEITGGFAISDTAANIGAYFDYLETDASNIQSISFTDTGTPVLKLTEAQVANDANLLADIKGSYDLVITGQVADNFTGNGTSDLLLENTAGAVAVGAIGGNGQESYTQVAALGPEWSFQGNGDFLGNGQDQFLIENTSGAVDVGNVVNGQTQYTQVAALGPEWKFEGTGDFLGNGQDQFLIENTSGAVDVGNVVNGQAQYTQVAALGPDWSFEGTGDFLGDGKTGFLIENTSGAVDVGEVSGGTTTYTQIAGLGPEWKFEGTGDFLGNGQDQFLIENTSGAVDVGNVVNGRVQYTQVAALGPEWSFIGTGDYQGTGTDGFMIENTAGTVALGTIANGQASYSQVGALGPEWSSHSSHA